MQYTIPILMIPCGRVKVSGLVYVRIRVIKPKIHDISTLYLRLENHGGSGLLRPDTAYQVPAKVPGDMSSHAKCALSRG